MLAGRLTLNPLHANYLSDSSLKLLSNLNINNNVLGYCMLLLAAGQLMSTKHRLDPIHLERRFVFLDFDHHVVNIHEF